MVLGLLTFLLVETCARCFFDEAKELGRLHVDHLCYSSLHYQKMRVIDIELDRAK